MGRGSGQTHGGGTATTRTRAPAAAPGDAKPSIASFEATLATLTAEVTRVQDDRDDYLTWLRSDPKMTRYDPEVVGRVLEQKPTATRIAGQRAWRTRGRRIRDDATPIRIGAGKKLTRPAVHPRTGTVITNTRLARRLGLKPTVVGWEREQTVYDISDTEPVDGGQRPNPRARQAIADMIDVGTRLGFRMFAGGAPPDDPLAERINTELINNRDAGGFCMKLREDGARVTVVATPGGADDVTQARLLAHELGHAILDHGAAAIPLMAELNETEAETFAYQLTAAYDVPSPDSAYYLVNRGGRAVAERLPRTAERVRPQLERFFEMLG